MFTVKVQHADGVEELHTANGILIVPRQQKPGGGENWDKAGIYLDPEPALLNPGESINDAIRSAREIILFSGDETAASAARKGGRVWVMNAQGATVSTYDL